MSEYIISQMHIEAARNSTDDFNLFHDKNRWHKIKENPFQGAVALGFQLGCFVEDQINCSPKNYEQQLANTKNAIVSNQPLNFSEYEINFAGTVKPGDSIALVVRDGRLSEISGAECFSNRIVLKANGKTVLLGYKRQTSCHIVKGIKTLPDFSEIINGKDRSFITSEQYFLKRKYMIVGNAKNFLTSSFAEQAKYIDEFDDKVSFPEMYPLSLLSSALLERAQAVGQDLIKEPMIYTSHKLSIDKNVLKTLKSNHALNILVSQPKKSGEKGAEYETHQCTCVLSTQEILFHAEIQLAPLASILKN
ncbi:hypothetical protein AADZ91_00185 [Colwelliaceae bacterium 6441]